MGRACTWPMTSTWSTSQKDEAYPRFQLVGSNNQKKKKLGYGTYSVTGVSTRETPRWMDDGQHYRDSRTKEAWRPSWSNGCDMHNDIVVPGHLYGVKASQQLSHGQKGARSASQQQSFGRTRGQPARIKRLHLPALPWGQEGDPGTHRGGEGGSEWASRGKNGERNTANADRKSWWPRGKGGGSAIGKLMLGGWLAMVAASPRWLWVRDLGRILVRRHVRDFDGVVMDSHFCSSYGI